MIGDADIIENCKFIEETNVLETCGNAQLGDLIGLQFQISWPRANRPGTGLIEARDQVEMVVLPAPLGPISPASWSLGKAR